MLRPHLPSQGPPSGSTFHIPLSYMGLLPFGPLCYVGLHLLPTPRFARKRGLRLAERAGGGRDSGQSLDWWQPGCVLRWHLMDSSFNRAKRPPPPPPGLQPLSSSACFSQAQQTGQADSLFWFPLKSLPEETPAWTLSFGSPYACLELSFSPMLFVTRMKTLD